LTRLDAIKNPGWPATRSTRDKTRVKNSLIFLKFFLSKLGCFDSFKKKLGQPTDPWPMPCLESIPESSFKIMIITIFVLILTRVNPSWPFRTVT
jgi:hypothetical protein